MRNKDFVIFKYVYKMKKNEEFKNKERKNSSFSYGKELAETILLQMHLPHK